MQRWNEPIALGIAAYWNNFTLDTELPWVLSSTPAKCEGHRMYVVEKTKGWKDRQTDRQTERDRQIERQRDRETNRQRDRSTEGRTESLR